MGNDIYAWRVQVKVKLDLWGTFIYKWIIPRIII